MPSGLGGYQPDTRAPSSRRADFDLQRRIKRIEGAGGVPGPPGTDGTDGVGVPAGGLTNEVLAKNSNTSYDTKWVPQTGGGGTGTDEVWVGTSPPTDPNIELWYDPDAAGSASATAIIAIPYDEWPPVSPQPDVLYLRIAP